MSSNISIFQYIIDKEISISHEISNINSGASVHIRIEKLFLNSPDFGRMNKKIKKKSKQIFLCENQMQRSVLIKELGSLKCVEKDMKIQVLTMLNLFASLKGNFSSKRLSKALKLFDKGKYHEANKVLDALKLANEQFSLLLKVNLISYNLERAKD